MAYRFTVNTDSYKDMRCSEKNWEPGTLNDFMHALNGWTIRENNLREVAWRIAYFGGWAAPKSSGENYPMYKAWLESHDLKKNYIKFYDNLCGFERRNPTQMYGFAQGYFDIDKKIEELKFNGCVKIYFKDYYDVRQYKRNMDGCYILIEKC